MKPKMLINKEGKKYLIKDLNNDLHTKDGFFKKENLKKAKIGARLSSNTKNEFTLYEPSFIDLYRKIRRSAQIIPLKDISLIISETGVNKKSMVVDAGAGSGALACFLAHLVKEVTTYDIRDDFLEIVEKNIKFLGLKNIKIKNSNIYNKIDERNVDLITLDLPEPWKALKEATKALKVGGFLVSYSPTIPQVIDFVKDVKKNKYFSFIKTSEIIERNWEIDERKVRPKSHPIGHSGFITFVRRI